MANNAVLVKANIDDYPTIQNLSRFCGRHPSVFDWSCPVIPSYTGGRFTEVETIVKRPKPHTKKVFRFVSPPNIA